MKIKVVYGDATTEFFDHVQGLMLTDNEHLLLVFDDEDELEINRPEYVKEVR